MEKIIIGKIINVVGLKGEIKVYSYTESLDRFKKLERIYIGSDENDEDLAEYKIKSVRYKGATVIISLEGVTNIDMAEALREKMVMMDESDLEELPKGVYYIRDLIGMTVVSDTGEVLGILKDVNTNTPQRIYEVQRNNGADILIPGVDEFILNTDMEKRIITVKVIEGLYED